VKIPWLQIEPDEETKGRLSSIESELVKLTAAITNLILKEKVEMVSVEEIKAKIAATLEEVKAQTTKIASIDTLMDGMRQQIIDLAAAAGASDEILSGIGQVFDEAKTNSATIDAVITENTTPA
jgi:hypothetical protein